MLKKNKTLTKKNKHLLQSNHTKNELLAIVAHDLRTPMYTLKTLHEELIETFSKGYLQKLQNQLTGGLSITSNTYHFVNNLLHWALAQNDQFFYTLESIHLKSIIDQVTYNFDAATRFKNLTLINTIPKEIFVKADLNTLKIIFHNLIDNGIKYSHTMGTIDIAALINKTSNTCELTIKDHGVGMDQETIQTILSSDKVVKGTHNKKNSTGLGLQLCKKLLVKNNAQLTIESKKNQGTIIKIHLPIYTN
ncbi:HAMP domain-containing sensor histidine kinase [Aquimarina sp. 2201CG1-2-11]|uniref:sensor histidine kinase n=1 Tax=Aquimarina discodermiae TaxID=3231043 RepID=UPI0034619FCE